MCLKDEVETQSSENFLDYRKAILMTPSNGWGTQDLNWPSFISISKVAIIGMLPCPSSIEIGSRHWSAYGKGKYCDIIFPTAGLYVCFKSSSLECGFLLQLFFLIYYYFLIITSASLSLCLASSCGWKHSSFALQMLLAPLHSEFQESFPNPFLASCPSSSPYRFHHQQVFWCPHLISSSEDEGCRRTW